jgi:glycosyltransferase involved in cell wall biosynthesis
MVTDMIDKKILEIAHVRTPGPAQDLCRYLYGKYIDFTYIEHPFKSSIDVLGSTGTRIYSYENGKLLKKIILDNPKGPEFVFWIRDVMQSVYIGLKSKKKYDLIICLDCLNTLSGIFLKLFGKTNYLIFYTIDFTGQRFSSKLLNSLYILLDKMAYLFADEVWDVSDGMRILRKKLNYKLDSKKEKIVPIGIFPQDFQSISKTRNKYKIIYLGSLTYIMGVQLAIDALPVLLKHFPKLTMEIIGTGEYKDELLRLVKKKKLESVITFLPTIDRRLIISELYSGTIGIAPYINKEGSFKKYCDPTKVKEYFGAGLPVIITKVPLIHRDISKYPLGISIHYNKTEYIDAIDKILSDKKFYQKCLDNIRNFIKEYYWDNIYTQALSLFDSHSF